MSPNRIKTTILAAFYMAERNRDVAESILEMIDIIEKFLMNGENVDKMILQLEEIVVGLSSIEMKQP